MDKRLRFGFRVRRTPPDFEALVRPHLEYLYKLAYRFTGKTDRAEDLIQDLLVRLYPKADELARVEQPRPWMVRVMYRMFVDDLRRYARAPLVLIDDCQPADAGYGVPLSQELVDPAPGPEEAAERKLNQATLMSAWEQLSADHKVLLTLHDIEGYTLAELEDMLETTRGTLKSRLHRARARLRSLLAAEPFTAAMRVSN